MQECFLRCLFFIYARTKPATCTEKGEKVAICGVCRQEVKEEIPMLEHEWDDGVVTKEATTTEKGVKTFTCVKCQTTKTEDIPVLIVNDKAANNTNTEAANITLFAMLAIISACGIIILSRKKFERK